ncbi:hypothetical protein DH2020_004786 [Rehmannia glutinosa]|uniref:Nuclease n=1 Tax=Rehmannia glutinosa TaxID=99300 RepID=A0ABR0XQS4_REHGL
MAEISRRRAEVFLIIEEIMIESFFVMNLFTRIIRLRSQKRISNHPVGTIYRMLDRIPKQVEHLNDLIAMNDVDCLDNLRMTRDAFARLCYLLKHVGGLVDSRYVSITEKVALFLSVLAHHKKNRVVHFDFKRFGQTVSRHFHDVLNSVLKLHSLLLVSPKPIEDNCTNARWKWFKGCLGALDGTYIKVTVSESNKARYRTRKGDVAVNVLGVCDINMNFIYVLSGWEGSAADCRILRDAVTRPNGLKVPQGNYYLCDNGYTNGEGFLTPYKGVRYHLNEWGEGTQIPQNSHEFFNMNHSKARNVIERTFGLLKKGWAILRSQSFYDIKIQNRIIMACALLHNFVRMELLIDPLEDELSDDSDDDNEDDIDTEFIDTVESSQAWNNWRDNLSHNMCFMEPANCKGSKGARKRNDKGRRSWSRREEEVLIAALKEIITIGWKSENGFKIGYLQALEQEMAKALPGMDLKGIPHINSKIHVWKKDYGSLVSMLSRSGIGWNDTTKMIEAHDEEWADYVKVDANARLMRFKSWPFYNDWVNIFGKDRATGEYAEGFTEAVNNVLNGNGMSNPDEEPMEQFPNLFEEYNDETETMSVCQPEATPGNSTSTKKSSGRKRKSSENEDPLVENMGTFCRNTNTRLADIAKRIGYEYDISVARKEVYGIVGTIQGLSLQEKLLVSKLLVKNTEDLELFFSLPAEAKVEFAKMKLAGNL